MNTKSSNVLIVVHTEIGLLIAILYYLKYLKNSKKAYFILVKTWKDRFENLSLDFIPGEYEIVIDELSGSKSSPSDSYKKIFEKKGIHELIVQNPLNLLVDTTINYYQKKHSEVAITLITDGVVTLSSINKKVMFKLFIKHLLRKYINKVNELPLFVRQYKDLTNIASKLISHQNIGFKEFINTQGLLKSIQDHEELLSSLFKINTDIYKIPKIIFFTQPIHLQIGMKEKYFDLIDKLVIETEKLNLKIIFKLHPADDLELYLHYENSKNVSIDRLNKNIPAEILLKLIQNKSIISVASSLSLSNLNPTLKHYWLCKMIDYEVDLKTKPEHIIVPKDINSLKKELKR